MKIKLYLTPNHLSRAKLGSGRTCLGMFDVPLVPEVSDFIKAQGRVCQVTNRILIIPENNEPYHRIDAQDITK